MWKKSTAVIKKERTDEEKLRRHLHGDKGARFNFGKQFWLDLSGISPSITTFVTKDIPLLETYESNPL